MTFQFKFNTRHQGLEEKFNSFKKTAPGAKSGEHFLQRSIWGCIFPLPNAAPRDFLHKILPLETIQNACPFLAHH